MKIGEFSARQNKKTGEWTFTKPTVDGGRGRLRLRVKPRDPKEAPESLLKKALQKMLLTAGLLS